MNQTKDKVKSLKGYFRGYQRVILRLIKVNFKVTNLSVFQFGSISLQLFVV